jgi:hypothetical protein
VTRPLTHFVQLNWQLYSTSNEIHENQNENKTVMPGIQTIVLVTGGTSFCNMFQLRMQDIFTFSPG